MIILYYFQTLEMLEKKEHVLQKKISREVEKAKDYTKAKNKKVLISGNTYLTMFKDLELFNKISFNYEIICFGNMRYELGNHIMTLFTAYLLTRDTAIQCLKKKKLYEAQIEQLGNFQLRVHDQVNSNHLVKWLIINSFLFLLYIAFEKSIDDIEKTMEQANEDTENMRQIQEALAMPVGAAADFDEGPGPDARIVYIDGAFDLFHAGHVEITTFNISLVVHGTIAENMDFLKEKSNPYAVPMAMGIYRQIESPLDITTSTIIRRIVSNHEAYQKRNEKKEASERRYYEGKAYVSED
ncbi:hypothetical protein COCNU_12G005900 [Cocos nucifera]|uniref:Ethanolamine-phosphate cytidylyltransferase n=1 Tax=Cocos nucifera TaxID=13894 RepID=A0A8K0IRL0_COCNU|nr:hypothetical protein COCNU_12G005900 [Cocos nucifera]